MKLKQIRFSLVLLILLTLTMACSLADIFSKKTEEPLSLTTATMTDEVKSPTVARVGDQIITRDDFELHVKYRRAQAINQITQYYRYFLQFGDFGESFLKSAQTLAQQLAQPVEFGRAVLDDMIDEVLIKEEAENRGIRVSEEEIDDAVQASFGFFPTSTQIPPASGSGAATPTPYTTEVFGENLKEFEALYAQYGMDLTGFRAIVAMDLLREKLMEAVTEDLDSEREEINARHILVATQAEALEILSLIEDGEDFADLAADYSLDTSTSSQGGALGWFHRETMVVEFSEAAFSLAIGEISEPVETSFGFHIIQVLDRRQAQMSEQEYLQYQRSEFTKLLRELRNSRDDIVVNDIWEEHVPEIPALPKEFWDQLFQQ